MDRIAVPIAMISAFRYGLTLPVMADMFRRVLGVTRGISQTNGSPSFSTRSSPLIPTIIVDPASPTYDAGESTRSSVPDYDIQPT